MNTAPGASFSRGAHAGSSIIDILTREAARCTSKNSCSAQTHGLKYRFRTEISTAENQEIGRMPLMAVTDFSGIRTKRSLRATPILSIRSLSKMAF
mgnify:FL=1